MKTRAAVAFDPLQPDRRQAVEAVNAAPEILAGRQLIGSRKPVDPRRLTDLAISRKEVAA